MHSKVLWRLTGGRQRRADAGRLGSCSCKCPRASARPNSGSAFIAAAAAAACAVPGFSVPGGRPPPPRLPRRHDDDDETGARACGLRAAACAARPRKSRPQTTACAGRGGPAAEARSVPVVCGWAAWRAWSSMHHGRRVVRGGRSCGPYSSVP